MLSHTIYFWSEQKEVHFKNNWLRKQSVDKSFVFFLKNGSKEDRASTWAMSYLWVSRRCRASVGAGLPESYKHWHIRKEIRKLYLMWYQIVYSTVQKSCTGPHFLILLMRRMTWAVFSLIFNSVHIRDHVQKNVAPPFVQPLNTNLINTKAQQQGAQLRG